MTQRDSFSQARRATLVAGLSLALPLPVMSQTVWKVGDRVSLPPLELLDGQSVDWAKLSGKVVVLEFWGTWCPFCARQNPILDKFYRDHQAKGLEVITISLDKTKDAASAYMKKGSYAFKAGMATPAWQAIYKQRRGLPQLMVIDRSGKLVMIEVREMLEDDIRDIAKFL
jgi:thiol-disulfide isomerase/thioredoxin